MIAGNIYAALATLSLHYYSIPIKQSALTRKIKVHSIISVTTYLAQYLHPSLLAVQLHDSHTYGRQSVSKAAA